MQKIQGKKYTWIVDDSDHALVHAIALKYTLSFPVAQTLVKRGYKDKEAIDAFLFPLADHVQHASQLKDAQKAVDRLSRALSNNEKILIAGDYDVDGITSSALMMLCMLPLNANINFFLPHRIKDGYGLSVKTIEQAAKNKYSVVITVDNGITSFAPAKRAKELGIDLIITDHHRPQGAIPDAYAVVNPNQEDCQYPFKKFAGVGVIFKLLTLLYEQLNISSLPSKAYELLLLGTIADVVPLLGENRYWVQQGLQYINRVESIALNVLKKNSKMQKPVLSASDIGYLITPQINALGRLEDPRQGVKFLIDSDKESVEQIGQVLLELNDARKNIERSVLQEICSLIEAKTINLDQDQVIIASSSQWPLGVIGLVASRLVGLYNRPALLFHVNKSGIAKGSCRSIPAFNIFNALFQVRDQLLQFGGHSVAAGLSLPQEKLPWLKEYLNDQMMRLIKPEELKHTLTIDASLTLVEVNRTLMRDLNYLQPFGNENPEPVFYVRNVTLIQAPLLFKDAHVKCMIFADGIIKPVIFFNRPDLLEVLNKMGSHSFDVAARLSEHYWNEKLSIDLIGIDIAYEGTSL